MSPTGTRLVGVILLLLCGSGAAAEDAITEERNALSAVQEQGEHHGYARIESGYRFISPDGVSSQANPYEVNRSGMTAGFAVGLLDSGVKVRADGRFLHPDDYQSELFFDYGGIIRAELEGRSLYHNLVRSPLFSSFTSSAVPLATYTAVPSTDPTSLGIVSRQDRADVRVRFGHFPGHLSLGYWRFSQTGHDQLLVADFERSNAVNNFYDVTRRIDQVTHEGRAGLDANLGPFSLAYLFKIREFVNNASGSAIPWVAPSTPFAIAVPAESRVTSHTVKLYSNLSGGLTAAAAYSITQRENISQRSDLSRSSQPQDTIQHLSGDLAYVPFKEVSVVLKYRHREIQRETPSQVSSVYSTAVSQVRPATSSTTDTLILASAWRPEPQLTLQGEYRADLIARENVWVPMTAATTQAVTADTSQLQTGTLSLLWRPWRGTRLNAGYSYTVNSQATTLNDFRDRHNGNLLFDWSSGGRWGVTAHYRATAEQNDIQGRTVTTPVVSVVMPRDSLAQSAGAAVWFSPLERLVVTASYGCMALDAHQALLLSVQSANALAATGYSSLGHVYGLEGVYAVDDRIDLSFGLQQVRSSARFQVADQSFSLAGPYPATTAGIGSYNRLDTTESSASTRIDWRFSKHLGWMLDYRFSAYRSDDAQYNGDIHSTTVSLTARW